MTTTTTTKTTRRAAGSVPDKRDAILRAALSVFAARGVNGVAVPEIAAAAGVATGTIYRYFPSKEALVNELYRQEKMALYQHLYVGIDRNHDDQKRIFDEFWRRAVSFAREHPDAYRFLELQDHRPYLDAESQALERRLLAPMVERVRLLQKRGVYRRDIRGRVLMSLTWGAFVNMFKAEREGLLVLKPKDLAAARDVCWQMHVGPANEDGRGPA